MEIRTVTPGDDFRAIGDIYAQSWKAAYRNIVPQEYLDELTGARWAAALPDSPWASLVLLDGDNYAGTSSFGAARDKEMQGWGEIISIYLLPAYFGKGFGGPLLAAALAELRKQGFDSVYLWALEENKQARGFYEKNGFVLSADRMAIDIGGKELTEARYVLRP